MIRAAVRQKKHSAAIGLDGVSKQDLANLTSNEMQSLVGLYRRAMSSGEWPQQVVQGLVKSLAKKLDPLDAPDYRPITIYSMVYRVWSSLLSRFWLSTFSEILSPTLSGNRSGHQASTLWRRVMEEVEVSQAHAQSTSGLILDLTKAFNTLPRLPCLCHVFDLWHGSSIHQRLGRLFRKHEPSFLGTRECFSNQPRRTAGFLKAAAYHVFPC